MPKSLPAAAKPCEYLGLDDDPSTCLSFPSYKNQCQRARPPAVVRLTYQGEYCLSALHSQCVVFKAAQTGPLPANLRERHVPSRSRRHTGPYVLIALLALALVVSTLWYFGVLALPIAPRAPTRTPVVTGESAPGSSAGAPAMPTAGQAPSPAPPAVSPTFAASATPADVSSVGALFGTPTPTQQSGSTRAGICGHQLDEPIGIGRQFIVHRVQSGDSLDMYATTYGTDRAAIEGVNAEPVTPLEPDQIIVIPLYQKAIEGVPAFRASQVNEKDARVTKLAATLGASNVGDFLFYNGYSFTECPIFSGWVLVPRAVPRPTPTLDCRPSGYQSAIICFPTPTPTHKEHGN